MKKYTIGIDFGTLSARAVVVDCVNAKTVGECTVPYPHGVMDKQLPCGKPLAVNYALQHPDDYLFSLKQSISGALSSASLSASEVAALCIDFTSCTVVAHKLDGTPVCNIDGFESDPHAYVKLWKHHGAGKEAADFLAAARKNNEPWLKNHGDQVSSEWMFPKILETYRNSRNVYDAADRFSEAADWLSLLLTGVETHSAPFAGNKSFYEGFYPSAEFFESVEEGFGSVIGTKVPLETAPVLSSVGNIDSRGAQLSGLCEGTLVCAPQLDAHSALLALGITRPGTLMLILGTSGCYILHDEQNVFVPGICACVKDGVIPGLSTYEAGISSCGDHLDWFVNNCVPADYKNEADRLGVSIHKYLRDKIKSAPASKSDIIAMNWFNGNRCPLSDPDLSGMFVGITLTTRPEQLYRALIEGIAFQTRIILERYSDAGIEVNDIIASGGIAKKDDMLMQILSDVTGRTIRVANDSQTAALGVAVYAATCAGIYQDINRASQAMKVDADVVYTPSGEDYSELFEIYKKLHYNKDLHNIMHTLKARSK